MNSTGKSLKCLEKSLILRFFVEINTVDRDLNQYKIVVPLFNYFTGWQSLTLPLIAPCADNLCKQFGPRSGSTKSKRLDTDGISENISWKS